MLWRSGWGIEGYRKQAAPRNRPARSGFAGLSLVLALLSSGCSLTMNLTGFSGEEETTASISQQTAPFPVALDDEDWRRVHSALSLAVDPQGAGLPVNWDNPGSKRRGSFEPSGPIALVGPTVCRPFRAKIVEHSKSLAIKESLLVGQACRTGPGEWAMRDVRPSASAAALAADQKRPPTLPTSLPAPLRRD